MRHKLDSDMVSDVLNNANVVAANHTDNTLAVWYGGMGFNVYNASTLEEVDYFSACNSDGSYYDSIQAMELLEDRGFTILISDTNTF